MSGQTAQRVVGHRDVVGRLAGHGCLGDPVPEDVECLPVSRAGLRCSDSGIVIAYRDEPSPVPAEVRFLEVVVREFQLPERRLQGVERREQRRFVLGKQRFGELPSGGQVLQYQIRVPFRARRVVPAHFARQYAAFGQVAGVEFAQRRDRAFDPGHGRRVEGHGDEPPLAMPFDFRLGEARRAHQARHAVGFRNGAGVGKHRQRQVGRQQCPGEMLQGHYHLYSVLTLMEPMLSMATSWAAEAL